MDEETMGRFLEDLASGAPTPGGGAAAAFQAALGAALISMVCNLTIGKVKYRAHEETMIRVQAEAGALWMQALALAREDDAAYGAVSAAYGLPRSTDDEKQRRSASIQQALRGAADVPLRTTALAARVVELAAEIVAGANPNVISDVGVGVLSARAALDGAALNVRINVAMIRDEDFTARVTREMDGYVQPARARTDEVMHAVEAVIGR